MMLHQRINRMNSSRKISLFTFRFLADKCVLITFRRNKSSKLSATASVQSKTSSKQKDTKTKSKVVLYFLGVKS